MTDRPALASPRPVRIEGVAAALPDGFGILQAEARVEGYRHLDRLAADWESGALRFERRGEALVVSHFGNEIAGIGGITLDPVLPRAFRLRRFYVRSRFRRCGIGRRLAIALLDRTARTGRLVTVNAAAGSEPFWEALGFVPDAHDGHTHLLNWKPAPNN